MTNLLAIALTVTLLAVWYGFSYQHGKHYGKWQVATVFVVFAVLSIPLGSSLKRIVYEAGATRTAKTVINNYFSNRDEPARIESFRIAFDEKHGIYIDTVILTKQYDTTARKDILALLQPALKRDVKFALDQLVVSQNPESVKALSLQAPQNTLSVPTSTGDNAGGNASVDSLAMLRAALPVPADIAPATDAPSVFVVHPKPVKGGNIGLFRTMEQQLSGQFSSLNIRLVPPVSRLPDIYFPTGEEIPGEAGMEALEDSLWALRRWEVQDVQVVGFASTLGEQDEFDNKSLAHRRAMVITDHLKEAGINAVIKSEYQTFEQRESEKRQGMRDFQKVEIRLMPAKPESKDSKKVP
jgi:hypothetical protein